MQTRVVARLAATSNEFNIAGSLKHCRFRCLRSTSKRAIVAFLDQRDREARRPHRRSRARHRPAARTPHRTDLRRRHRQDRRARAGRTGGRMSLHKEINFEDEICEHLAAHGWLYAEGDAAKYDRARALFPDDVLAWVQATQPKAWEALVKNHGAHAAETLLDPPARLSSTSAARSTCCGTASSCWACAATLPLAAVQAGAGDQPRHPGPLRRQPAARRPAGALLAAQRELHRPGAVPERHAGGDGRAEDRLHAEHRRRDRPVPLRPPPQAQGPGRRAAARRSRAARWCTSPSATAKST